MIFVRVIYEEKDETKHESTFTAKRECRVHEVLRLFVVQSFCEVADNREKDKPNDGVETTEHFK